MKKLIMVLMLLCFRVSAGDETNKVGIGNIYAITNANPNYFLYMQTASNLNFNTFFYSDEISFSNVEFVVINNCVLLNLTSNQMGIVKNKFPGRIYTNSITIY